MFSITKYLYGTVSSVKTFLADVLGSCNVGNIFTSTSSICVTVFVIYLVTGKHGVNSLMQAFYRRVTWKHCVPKIITNEADSNTAVLELRSKCKETPVIGLDCEWVNDGGNNRTKKVALLQLASSDGNSSLFRLCKIGHVPPSLSEFLSDGTVLKTGVAICNDASRLLKDYGVQCNGCLDLRHMASHLGLQPLGLGKLSRLYLGENMNKDWRVRCSNWEAETLTSIQIQYASQDALAAVDLFHIFNEENISLSVSWWKRFNWTKKQSWDYTLKTWSRFVGLGFSQNHTTARPPVGNVTTTRQIYTRPPPSTARQKPLYHNIFLQSPNGTVLCTCDDKKALWYLGKGLANIIKEEPLTLRLTFEPSGKNGCGDSYYALPKDNVCAVCSSTNSLRRKNIVPHEYRKFFPVEMKDHSSHDVLLLCVDCHCKSQHFDLQFKLRLAEECNAPLANTVDNCSRTELPEMRTVKSAAWALLQNSDKIPENRKLVLQKTLIDFLEKHNLSTELTNEVLVNLGKSEIHVQNTDFQPHGSKVVEFYKNKSENIIEGLRLLEQSWRKHFVTILEPKHLPERWSVTYAHTQHRT